MSKKILVIVSILVLGSIALAACASGQQAGEDPVSACLVTDSAGIGDRSFNDAVWKGLEMAEEDFGSEITYIESKSADDYAPNIQACIDAESEVVICVGFMMGDACAAAIDANPDTKFVGVDIYGLGKDNFIGIDAYMEQSSFLAGYLAAGMTETGVLGTWTGFVGPVVLSFMDGFYSLPARCRRWAFRICARSARTALFSKPPSICYWTIGRA